MGRKPTPTYNLKTKYPVVAKEWDYKKNKTKPEEYLPVSTKKVWWICTKNHSWERPIKYRTSSGNNCPYCSGQLPSKEYNLKKYNPKLAKEWDYKKKQDEARRAYS